MMTTYARNLTRHTPVAGLARGISSALIGYSRIPQCQYIPMHAADVLCRSFTRSTAAAAYAPTAVVPHEISPQMTVTDPSIEKPNYALTGRVPESSAAHVVLLHGPASADRMRKAARLARTVLDIACSLAKPGVTTDEIDKVVYKEITSRGAYPSPLNYCGFPKSLCSSINEIICHGIPDARPLQYGDVVSFDVSCFVGGVHGDNCGTVIVGDGSESEHTLSNEEEGELVPANRIERSRLLVQATREALAAGIEVCRPGACLTDVGAAIHEVVDKYGYDTVREYRGHGIASEFHCAPFVKVRHKLCSLRCTGH